MIHHHSSGKRRLWKRIFSMCIALILICGMTVPASSVSASQEMAGTVEEQTLKDESGQTTDVLSADSESSDQQQVSDSGSGTSEDQSEDENEDQILSDEQTDTDMTDETEETTTENSGDSNSTQPEETKPETPENGEQTGTEEDKGTDGALTEDETGEGDTAASDGTEADEGETEETVTYEQAARAALVLYGEEAAFRANESIELLYFEFYVDGAPYEETVTGTVGTGPISEDTVPIIEGYEFDNATIDGIQVESVGTLSYNDVQYVYYTTEGSSTSLAAMVLESGKKIRLNYETPREAYSITYNVTGGEYSADDVFNTERPLTVTEGNSYAFRVTIPRGYTAIVLVNGQEVGRLGTEPSYEKNGNIIKVAEGSPEELMLTGTYEVENVHSAQNVTVQLTERNEYTFSAELWTETDYARGRADFDQITKTFQEVSNSSNSQLWTFTTDAAGRNGITWILDSLQINGTKLEIPYGNYIDLPFWGEYPQVSETTILPSGTEITVILTNVERSRSYDTETLRPYYVYSRTYTVSVSNCYENITITGGNLVNGTWPEIIPKTLTGVDVFKIPVEHMIGGEKIVAQSEPFSVGNRENGKNYWFGEELQFKLLPGYVNPQVTYTTTDGDILSQYLSFDKDQEPDAKGWYTFKITGNGGNNITMLEIEAEVGQYQVTYNGGDVENAGTLPSDGTVYSITEEDQIIVSNRIPTDPENKNAFEYWTLNGYVDNEGKLIPIYPNALLDLEDIAECAVEGSDGIYELPLTAHWIENEQATQITYSIEFIWTDDSGTEQKLDKGTYQAVAGSTIILDTNAEEVQEFLADHSGYVLDEEKTVRYNSDIQLGAVLKVYFKKNVTDVTVTKLVTGKLGDLEKDFSFSWSYKNTDGTMTSGTLNELSHNESDVIKNVPVGSVLTLKESGALGYTTTAENGSLSLEVEGDGSENDVKTITVTISGNDNIIVTNDKDPDPDTGIRLTSWPYILTLTFVSAGAVTLGVYKCRKRHD